MALTIAVNEKNDIYLDSNGNLAMVSGLTAVLQACEQACKTKLGEMILQTQDGIPYFEVVFVGVPNIPQFELSLRQAILGVQGVIQIKSLIITRKEKLLTYVATIQTIYGTGTIPGSSTNDADLTSALPTLDESNYDFQDETGTIVPDTSTLLTQVQNEWKSVFGQDLITTPNTPQGVLITIDALSRAVLVANNSQIANQINPNLAGGVFLDAIWALTGGKRTSNQFTTVSANLTGQPETVIPAGSLAQDSVTGYQYALLSTVTLDGSGNGSGIFQCTTAGPITVASGNLTIIVVGGVLGWETVTNPDVQITIGSTTQDDNPARNQRRSTLALQGTSLSEAIISGVKNIPGVLSLSFRENYTASPITIDGVTLVANSIYVCVDVENTSINNTVATTLDSKKSGGCNYNGSITIDVTDPFSGQVIPVKFDNPTEIQIQAQVTIIPDLATQNPQVAVIDAITNYATGQLSQEPGLMVGQDVSPSEFAGAINRQYPGIFIQDVKICIVGGTLGYANVSISINEVARIQDSNIAVVIP